VLDDADGLKIPSAAVIPMRRLLAHRETRVILIGRSITEPVWWFYLYWAPKFLSESRGLTLRNVGLPLMAIYGIANLGGLFGGWLSSTFIKRGWTVNAARKCAVLACALLAVPVASDSQVHHVWVAVGILGLAMAGHQGWASNLFAMLTDIFPRQAVASVTGFTICVRANAPVRRNEIVMKFLHERKAGIDSSSSATS